MSKVQKLGRQLVNFIRYPKLFLKARRAGWNNIIGPGGRFFHHNGIFFSDNIYIGPDFHISARNLKVGSGVLIGPNLLLEGDDHIYQTIGKSMWETRNERNVGFVTIEDDVWIGGNVTILKNVNIGEGCIVGAASVVTKSLPPYTICIGTPCRPVKSRFNKNSMILHLSSVKTKYTPEEIFNLWKTNNITPED